MSTNNLCELSVVEELLGENVCPRLADIYLHWEANGILNKYERLFIYDVLKYIHGRLQGTVDHYDIVVYSNTIKDFSTLILDEMVYARNSPVLDTTYSNIFTVLLKRYISILYGDTGMDYVYAIIDGIVLDDIIRTSVSNLKIDSATSDEALRELATDIVRIRSMVPLDGATSTEYVDVLMDVYGKLIRLRDTDSTLIQKEDISISNICEIISGIINNEEGRKEELERILKFITDNLDALKVSASMYNEFALNKFNMKI